MDQERIILVTGATGRQGGAVARELLRKGHRVRAMTRKPREAPAQELGRLGAEVVTGDLDDAGSLADALDGAWGVFAVQNTWEAGVEREEQQGTRLVDVARKKGVEHFVYSSVASAHRKTGIPHFENKWRVEERVRAAGFPSHVILRPVFFMENWTTPWFYPAIQKGSLAVALKPTTALQMIATADIGRYGLWAFEHHADLNGREVDIAGDEKTMPEAARILSEAWGRPIRFVPLAIEAVRSQSEDYALMLEWFDRVGYNADIRTRSKESGIAPTTFASWAKAHASAPSAVA
jgi:uncharacterized protein YbjT (DUF2867 family)